MRRWFHRQETVGKKRAERPIKTFPAGIKLLHDPRNAVVDVVFVHGLTGDRDRTWTARGTDEPWPKTLLPSELPTVRALTFGYDAYVADWRGVVSQSRIANHAWALLTSLSAYQEKDNTDKRPIIFVCHSLGGLVCEDAVVTSRQRTEQHFQDVLRSTRGIAFLGTPHHGAGLARWGELLSRSIGVIKQTTTEIVAVLRRDSEVLARIQDGFHTMVLARGTAGLPPIEISCFFEELPLPGIGQVVPQDSAILAAYVPIGIRGNHMDMTKFASPDDPGFSALCGVLRRWIRQIDRAGAAAVASGRGLNPVVPADADASQGGQGGPPLPNLNTSDQLIGAFDTRGWTILHAAVRRGHPEGAKLALDAGLDPNTTTDEELWTPLWVAAGLGRSAIARLLLEAGANPRAVTRNGDTALRQAAMIGAAEIVELLIMNGADLEACPPRFNDTPLICAAGKGREEAVRILLEAGANVNAQRYGGWSALHYSLLSQNDAIFRLILRYKPDVNNLTKTGVQPLHLAVNYGLASLAVELLDHGAAINAEDQNGTTPLQVAIQSGHLDTVRMLVGRGAKTDATDNHGRSMLRIATMLGYTDIYLFLERQSNG